MSFMPKVRCPEGNKELIDDPDIIVPTFIMSLQLLLFYQRVAIKSSKNPSRKL